MKNAQIRNWQILKNKTLGVSYSLSYKILTQIEWNIREKYGIKQECYNELFYTKNLDSEKDVGGSVGCVALIIFKQGIAAEQRKPAGAL